MSGVDGIAPSFLGFYSILLELLIFPLMRRPLSLVFMSSDLASVE